MAKSGYYNPNAAGSANLGTYADPWTTEASAEAGTSAGEEIWVMPGTYNQQFGWSKSGTGDENRIGWLVCTSDGSRLATDTEIANGTYRATFDGESSRSYSIYVTTSTSWVWVRGIYGDNSVSHGWHFTQDQYQLKMEMCGHYNAGGNLLAAVNNLYRCIITGGSWENATKGLFVMGNAIIDNLIIGNITEEAISITGNSIIINNIIHDVTSNRAIKSTGMGNAFVKNTLYNVSTGIELTNGSNAYGNYIEDADIGIKRDGGVGHTVATQNAYFNCTVNDQKDSTTYSITGDEHVLVRSKLQDPANGNYMSDPATDDARSMEYPIDDVNSVFVTAGISPEIPNVTLPSPDDVRDGVSVGENTGNLELPSIDNVEDGITFGTSGTEFTGNLTLPIISNVRQNIQYGTSGTEFTGSLIVPSEDDVRDGITVDNTTGNLTLPNEDYVIDSIQYGTSGTEFTGNNQLPSIDNVEDGITFGTSGIEYEGNLSIPTSADVRESIQYGTSGTEFTGGLIVPSEDDVRDGITVDNTTGNLTLPTVINVKSGITYGTSGTEFTGILEARDPISISYYSQTSGYTSGSDEIVLSGSFGSEGDVYFGCDVWQNQYWSSTLISGTTPEVNEDQTVKVYVINGDNVASIFDFTYYENPTVDTYTSYSSLPDADYFKKCTTNYNSERELYDLLLTEAYNKSGTCMTYHVTDYDTTKDQFFGEDTDRHVLRSFDIMAHGELPQEEALWSKFGIEGLDNFQIFVAKRHFQAASSQGSYSATVPRIGDMIHMNHNNRIYDVVDVGQEEEQFLQGKHTWVITLTPHKDTHVALSADTSATMGDISAATNQTSDEYDISDFIESEVSAVEYNTSGETDSPSTIWGDW